MLILDPTTGAYREIRVPPHLHPVRAEAKTALIEAHRAEREAQRRAREAGAIAKRRAELDAGAL